jgi:hypothetical protein
LQSLTFLVCIFRNDNESQKWPRLCFFRRGKIIIVYKDSYVSLENTYWMLDLKVRNVLVKPRFLDFALESFESFRSESYSLITFVFCLQACYSVSVIFSLIYLCTYKQQIEVEILFCGLTMASWTEDPGSSPARV